MNDNTSASDICKVCSRQTDLYENAALQCIGECQRKVHISCLQRGALPSNFLGDVFYDLHCTACSDSNEELFVRQKLSWLTTVILTLYNLREKSSGISRRGYFHWKSDISTFININWDQLFNKTVKRKKNWIGTISGTLSHYSGVFFKSGTSELGDQGWWKLLDNDPPEVLVNKYYKVLELKKQHQAKLKSKSLDNTKPEICNSYEDNNSIGTESFKYNITRSLPKIEKTVRPVVEISQSISACEEFNGILDLDIDMPDIDVDFPSFNFGTNTIPEELTFQSCNKLPEILISDCLEKVSEIVHESSVDVDIANDPLSENLQIVDTNAEMESDSEEDDEQKDNNGIHKNYNMPPPQPSLFNESIQRPWPWDESIKLNPEDVRPLMSKREEEYLLQKIEKHKHLLHTAPPTVRRLYRKLAVRKLKREYGLPILNLDTFGKQVQKSSQPKKKGNVVLDRFISEDISVFFEQRLQGYCEPTAVPSPYTNRLLKPFIRRDTSTRPLWLKVMGELLAKVHRKDPNWKPKPTAPIDYSYIKPQHIPAINTLCTQFFWPGVDLTECLQYPDFTCVVLYKKLVIGFAIMVPDVGYYEAYISFFLVRPEWQKAGIGTFMLYHLIQTCMGKDITLHVSATNPALILYQKFGFKQEEFVQDFYDKYIPPSSKESRHALFLRLSR